MYIRRTYISMVELRSRFDREMISNRKKTSYLRLVRPIPRTHTHVWHYGIWQWGLCYSSAIELHQPRLVHCQIRQQHMFSLLSRMLNLTVLPMCCLRGKHNNFVHQKFQFYPVYIMWIIRTWLHQQSCFLVAPLCFVVTSQLLLLQHCYVIHKKNTMQPFHCLRKSNYPWILMSGSHMFS